jgi:glucan biosynthesis protein
VNEISIEYSRMFQGEEENSSALGVAGAIKSQSNNMNQQKEQREQKREKFLIEFNSSQLYSSLRQKLKKAIFRLAVEKYNKQVDHKGLHTK